MSQTGQPREKKKRLLSREQQAIWRRENRAALKGKSKDERTAAREKMISQIRAMSEPDRAKLLADLQSKWDALPEAEKQELKKKGKGKGGRKGGKQKGNKAGADDDDDE